MGERPEIGRIVFFSRRAHQNITPTGYPHLRKSATRCWNWLDRRNTLTKGRPAWPILAEPATCANQTRTTPGAWNAANVLNMCPPWGGICAIPPADRTWRLPCPASPSCRGRPSSWRETLKFTT